MTRPSLAQLKADAFALSKILATHKVKLSSQQCLDVLSKLTSNVPYEALLSQEPPRVDATDEPRVFLTELLDTSKTFCELLAALDQEGVKSAAWNKAMPAGLHRDGRTYLMSVGAASQRFMTSVRQFVQRQQSASHEVSLSVERSDPIMHGKIAVLRMRHRGSKAAPLGPIDWSLSGDPLLYGFEGRIELATLTAADAESDSQRVPAVDVIYEACGQEALHTFGFYLREAPDLRKLLKMVPTDIETNILLTGPGGQDEIEAHFRSDAPKAHQRLLAFCEKASNLTHEETRDWPPYFRLSRRLTGRHTDVDLDDVYGLVRSLVAAFPAETGGLPELYEARK